MHVLSYKGGAPSHAGFRAFRAVASGLGQGSPAVGMIESSALNVLVAAYPFL